MIYRTKKKKGRPKAEEKYRTIRNYKALKGYNLVGQRGNKVIWKKD
jgi:hypothetical protein